MSSVVLSLAVEFMRFSVIFFTLQGHETSVSPI